MNQQKQLKKILSLIVTNTAKHHFQERWILLKSTDQAGLFLDAVLEKLKASEDEKKPTATTKKHTVSNPPSANIIQQGQRISNRMPRNYQSIQKHQTHEQRKCPVCGDVSKYSICPEHWFGRGRFMPTNKLEVHNEQT